MKGYYWTSYKQHYLNYGYGTWSWFGTWLMLIKCTQTQTTIQIPIWFLIVVEPNKSYKTWHFQERFHHVHKTFTMDYDDDSALFGSLQDYKDYTIGIALRRAQEDLFANRNTGILIAESKSFIILRYGHKYNFTKSY